MADKTYEIEVKTTSDVEGIQSVKDALQQTKEEAESTRDALEQAFQDATAEVERLEEALNEAIIDGDDIQMEELDLALADAREKADNLEEALNNINSGAIDDAIDSVDALSDSLGNAGDSSEELNSSMGLIDSAVMMNMSQEVGKLGDSAESMAQEMNTASISVGQLAKNSGVAESQMVSLINNISNKTFPQEEAIQYINALNQMGISADKLGDSATNMDRINDATHIGASKVMTLTAGLQSMGITADNLPASFNAIAYAEANVFDGTNTLSQVLRTQAGTINEYGLNVDQLVVVLSTLQSQTGLTGRKLSSELATRLKDCNGDVGALEQSLGLTTGTLSNASDMTGKYAGQIQNLADEEMEHKSILDDINAGWEDMQLSLSPILSPLASFMGLIGQVGSWAVGINGLITLATTIRDAEIAQWALNLAMSMNPIMILVIAIGILIGVLVYLYFNNEQVRNAINNLGQAFMEAGQIIYTAFVDAINFVITTLQNAWNYITTLGGLIPQNAQITGNQVIDTVLKVMGFFITLPIQIAIIFTNIIAKTLGFGNNFAQNMIKGAINTVTGFINKIRELPGMIQEEFNRISQIVSNFITDLPNHVWDLGASIVQALKNALGIGSPGFMYYMVEGEFNRIKNAPSQMEYGITKNVRELGESITDEFNPSLSIKNAEVMNRSVELDGNGMSQTNNFYFNDIVVDDDERMEKICNYITKKLTFNNKTANRTV